MTEYDGSDEEERALDLQIKLFRATNSLRRALSRFWDDHNLTESQFATLEALHHLGTLNHKEIAEKMLTHEANITHVVDNLERDGLVDRQRSEADRRVVEVHLTSEGQEVIQDVFPKFVDHLTETIKEFDASKQNRLAQLSEELGQTLES